MQHEVTETVWANDWIAAWFGSGLLQYLYILNIWHLKDTKRVSLHNVFLLWLRFNKWRKKMVTLQLRASPAAEVSSVGRSQNVCDGLSAVPEMRFLKGLMILYGICILGFLRGSVKIW